MEIQDDSDDVNTSGWDAINGELARIHGDREPSHWGTLISYRLGGPDPLDGISAYRRDDPDPHWHYVTYGLSELYAKESEDPEVSGFGFELTLRLARAPGDEQPPTWPLSFLNNLARYVFQTGNVFRAGDHMDLNGPIALDEPGTVTAMGVTEDPELPPVQTPNGRLEFLQVVGLVRDEYEAVLAWNTRGMLQLMQARNPLLVTRVNRPSFLADEAFRAGVRERTRAEGSSTGIIFNDQTAWSTEARLLRGPRTVVTTGAQAGRLAAAILQARLSHGQPFTLAGQGQQVTFEAGPAASAHADGTVLRVTVPPAALADLVAALGSPAGEHAVPALGAFAIHIAPTVIRDRDGNEVQRVE